MEITLEKIELVRDRTGVSYKEAKEALEAANGSVVDAIINLEETMDERGEKNFGEKGAAIIDSIKELVKKGNVSKIVISKKEGEVLLSVPVNVGILGTIIAPWGIVAATAAAFGFKCKIEVVKNDGTIVEVSERAVDAANIAMEKGSVAADSAKKKSKKMADKVKKSDFYDKVRNSDAFEKVKEQAENAQAKAGKIVKTKKQKAKDFAEDFMDDMEETIDDIKEAVTVEMEVEKEKTKTSKNPSAKKETKTPSPKKEATKKETKKTPVKKAAPKNTETVKEEAVKETKGKAKTKKEATK